MMEFSTVELKVFISGRDSICDSCKEPLGRQAWIFLAGSKGALCLSCADLDHLIFLASGDATLTRRAKKYSNLHAVVLKWNKARKRYERQGILVEEEAIGQAEADCFKDEELRARRRARAAEQRRELDKVYVKQFASEINKEFPGCPANRSIRIAEHACRKYSGRVGRSAAAKAFDKNAILLAVTAHIRHTETKYDEVIMSGWERSEARSKVQSEIDQILQKWRGA